MVLFTPQYVQGRLWARWTYRFCMQRPNYFIHAGLHVHSNRGWDKTNREIKETTCLLVCAVCVPTVFSSADSTCHSANSLLRGVFSSSPCLPPPNTIYFACWISQNVGMNKICLFTITVLPCQQYLHGSLSQWYLAVVF